MLSELEAGVRTRADIWAEQGEDWKEQTEQLAKEAKFINEMAAKYGVPREQIAAPPKPSFTPVKLPGQQPEPKADHVPIRLPRSNGNGHSLVQMYPDLTTVADQ